jgi:uncharacterized membrane protein YraQ (UPF0718 family)
MNEALIWGFCLRVAQAFLQAAPFIFTGLCVAGLLHRLMGHAQTRWLFGSNTIGSLFQSWVIGMLLPGCSLGTIPIVKQMRKSGIAVGTIFAFALSSPLFDPLSLLYGLTLSKPATILAFALCSLVVVTICGALFDRWFPNTEVQVEEPPPTPYGVKRLLAVFVMMSRESISSSSGFVFCGLLGTAALSLFLPVGSLQRTMAHDNSWSPMLMTAIAIPAYTTPMNAMGQLGSMFQHGNSIGAAFNLLIFGAGVNMGLIAWMAWNYGGKKCLIWFGLMIAVVSGIAYGIERPLFPRDIQPIDHTHAFDTYCRAYSGEARPTGGYAADVWRRIRLETQLHELAGAVMLTTLILAGLGLRKLDQRFVIEEWLNRPKPELASKSWDIVLPRPVLVGIGFFVLVAGSIVGCYAYYPSPDEAIADLQLAKTEALGGAITGERQHALHWIPVCESWNRRLQVGAYIRSGRLSEYHRMKSKIFRDKMEVLEHLVEEEGTPKERITKQASETALAFSRMVRAFRQESP